MKLFKLALYLSIPIYICSCIVDCEPAPTFFGQNNLIIRVPNDANHSIKEDIKLIGIGKVVDTLTAWVNLGQNYYDYETNQYNFDSTYIIYELNLPIDKKSSSSAFQIFYRDQADTISYTYSSVLKEKRIGHCNSNKYEYEISNLSIDKITFDTISKNPNETSYYYYGSIIADFQ